VTEKVFVIGFQRTGTTSVGAALETLGYHLGGAFGGGTPRGTPLPLPLTQAKLADAARAFALRADAFEDNPWPVVFREMDAAFPGSKFILTRRDPASWIDSMVRHFGQEADPMRSYIYGHGAPVGHETEYLCRYQRHIDEVLGYFAGRPQDLLVVNLDRWTWEDLCGFLNKPVPAAPLPYIAAEAPPAPPLSRLTRMVQGILRRGA
jgi:hypothetical protein